MQIGLLGLGKMGKLLAEKWMGDGHQVVVWNRSKDTLDKYRLDQPNFILNQRLVIVHSIEEYREKLLKPRVFWSMLPAGEATESVLTQVLDITEQGDIVIDGGNANYKDTERRAGMFKEKGVRFLGIGLSGGVHAKENGCCLMVGGDKDGYDYLAPLLDSLIKPYGVYTFFGPGGAGHFVKMAHNGIEYGMMQSIAEGFAVLAKSEYKFNLIDVARTYLQGSIVASFLVQMVMDSLTKDPVLSQYEGVIDATGEAKWTIEYAKEKHIPINAIEQALEFRNKSQYDKAVQDTFVAKLVSAMRHEFGGHEETKTTTEQKPQEPPKQ